MDGQAKYLATTLAMVEQKPSVVLNASANVNADANANTNTNVNAAIPMHKTQNNRMDNNRNVVLKHEPQRMSCGVGHSPTTARRVQCRRLLPTRQSGLAVAAHHHESPAILQLDIVDTAISYDLSAHSRSKRQGPVFFLDRFQQIRCDDDMT